jgi:DNA-directed RNA polymerase specialized sigma24 family protein
MKQTWRVAVNPRTSGRKVVVIEKATSYVDAQEAARMLGVNKRAVRNLIARRRLESRRDGGGAAARLLVSVASLEKLRSERQPDTG